jgi:hypothetical protein
VVEERVDEIVLFRYDAIPSPSVQVGVNQSEVGDKRIKEEG